MHWRFSWVAVSILFTANIVDACGCIDRPLNARAAAEREFNQSQVVFEGQVLPRESEGGGSLRSPYRNFRDTKIIVSRIYKGHIPKIIDFGDGNLVTSCDDFLWVGKSYLVYADEYTPGIYSISSCGRTAPIEDAGADLRFLRKEPPTEMDLLPAEEARRRSTGVLCGRVARADGRPLGSIDVSAWRLEGGFTVLASGDIAQANGNYRIEGLKPGQYIVSAISLGAGDSLRLLGVYGGGIQLTNGQLVQVEAQAERNGFDFELLPQPLYVVSGKFVSTDGDSLPDERTHVSLEPLDDDPNPFANYSDYEVSQGVFRIQRVPAGRYKLIAWVNDDKAGEDEIEEAGTNKHLDPRRWQEVVQEIEIAGSRHDLIIQFKPIQPTAKNRR